MFFSGNPLNIKGDLNHGHKSIRNPSPTFANTWSDRAIVLPGKCSKLRRMATVT
jgi:hypothetical protein